MNSHPSPPSDQAQEELNELVLYREKVLVLLRERELKYKALEQDRMRLSYLLKESSVEKLVRSGDAGQIMERDSIRRAYTAELQKVDVALSSAREELDKARERLVQIDADIQQLHDSQAGQQ